jgi:hypothetical protein
MYKKSLRLRLGLRKRPAFESYRKPQRKATRKRRNAALALWWKEAKRGPGNPRIDEQERRPDGTFGANIRTVDNINNTDERPTGTSIAAGIRTLQKAAAEGNEDAIRELAEVEAGRKPARQSGYGHAGTERQDAKARPYAEPARANLETRRHSPSRSA